MNRLREIDWWPLSWAALLTVLMLGPALAPGLVLSYDMVWVPDLVLRPDFFGAGSGLPRAVPSDAVVAVLDEVIPGGLLQKLMLVGSLVAAGSGAAALVGGLPLPARLAAVTVSIWNPFLVERLVLGHWPLLVGYAVLPWLLLAAWRSREEQRVLPALMVLAPLGSLSASAGLVSAIAVLAAGVSRDRVRTAAMVALLLASNAPWLVAGFLHRTSATSDPVGAQVFATEGEGWLPGPIAALGLGGIWNSEVVPTTRTGILGVATLVVVLGLCALGIRSWREAQPSRIRVTLVCCWAVGWGVAAFSWAAPEMMGWLAGTIPGGGLLRDGSRLLGLCVPLMVVLVAHGVARAIDAAREPGLIVPATLGLVLAPVALMPDAAWGVNGALDAVELPASYARAHDLIGEREADGAIRGDLVALPFSSYRAPEWNQSRKVLDPVGRALPLDYVVDDRLIIDGRRLSGEDPRANEVRFALAEPTAQARARALARLGIGVVAVDPTIPDDRSEVAGRVLISSEELRLIQLADPVERPTPMSWRVWLGLAWAAFLAGPLLALGIGLRRLRAGPASHLSR